MSKININSVFSSNEFRRFNASLICFMLALIYLVVTQTALGESLPLPVEPSVKLDPNPSPISLHTGLYDLHNNHPMQATSLKGDGPGCGNGIPDVGEFCDDGNLNNHDGCSLACTVEPGYSCTTAVAPQIVNAIGNGDFETENPSSDWIGSSENFGSPLCDVSSCGAGNFATANSGDGWVWLGGSLIAESAAIEQSLIIQNTDSSLSFAFSQSACDSDADVAQVLIDDVVVFSASGADPTCDSGGYQTVTIDLLNAPGGPFNDGSVHTLGVEANTFALNGGASNFLFDDFVIPRASIPSKPSLCTLAPNICQIETFDDGVEGDVSQLGWSTFAGITNSSGSLWGTTDDGLCGSANGVPGNVTGGSGYAACIDSDVAGLDVSDAYLCSGAMNLSSLTGTALQFKFNYQIFGPADSNDRFQLLAGTTSPTGASITTFTPIYTSDGLNQGALHSLPGATTTVDLSAFSGEPEVYVCFYFSGQFDWSAQVDDVALIADSCVIPDSDLDGIPNSQDNCTWKINPSQIDSNGDGIGNVCDADVAGALGIGADDCIVNAFDLNAFASAYLSTPSDKNWNPDTDLSGADGQPDSVINAFDLFAIKTAYFGVPGPSATGECQ